VEKELASQTVDNHIWGDEQSLTHLDFLAASTARTDDNRTMKGKLLTSFFRYLAAAGLIAAALESSVALAQPAQTPFGPPTVPFNLEVPTGNTLYLKGEAKGTQNYVCLPSAGSKTGFAFKLFTPQATLFLPISFTGNGFTQQIITHFFSPNPDPLDNGAIRATWQSSLDTSAVWAATVPDGVSTDGQFVKTGAVPWLLLEKKGTQRGSMGGEGLSQTTFVQRLNTDGGVAPATGCSAPGDVGTTAFVPYTADYFFYKASRTP
jgi:hypothetical protein